MPDDPEPLDPVKVLVAIRTLARAALSTEQPWLYTTTLQEIVQACDNALPPRQKAGKPTPP